MREARKSLRSSNLGWSRCVMGGRDACAGWLGRWLAGQGDKISPAGGSGSGWLGRLTRSTSAHVEVVSRVHRVDEPRRWEWDAVRRCLLSSGSWFGVVTARNERRNGGTGCRYPAGNVLDAALASVDVGMEWGCRERRLGGRESAGGRGIGDGQEGDGWWAQAQCEADCRVGDG
jgi:hypothetical protein